MCADRALCTVRTEPNGCAVKIAPATSERRAMESRKESRRLKVGQPITPDEFDELSDEQLARLVPRAYREFFPGKDFCADGSFYLHDGTAWSFYKAGFVDD
jgi:hypothetical protein